ncbi:YxeA family protein [Clostridium sp. Marseille-Q7071]
MKKIIITFIFLVIGVGAFFMSNSELADRMNPFLKRDTYYTVVKTDGKYLGKDKIRKEDECYQYEFIGYNGEGKEQKIIINAPKNLRHGAYLSVQSAGKSGKNYGEVQLNEIPEAAKAKLGLK